MNPLPYETVKILQRERLQEAERYRQARRARPDRRPRTFRSLATVTRLADRRPRPEPATPFTPPDAA